VEVQGASAIVTGGASGIGEATARALQARRACCVIVDRDEGRGLALAAEIGAEFVLADVASEEDITLAIRKAQELGPLRVLVNAAGVSTSSKIVGRGGEPHSLEAFERIVRVNLVGTFNCMRLAASAMILTESADDAGARGVIVNMTSSAAFEGQIGQSAYAASKGGVVSMTLPAARDLARNGIRVNTISPGLIDTPIYGSGERSQKFKEMLSGNLLFPPRFGTADEIASMVLEIVANDYVNAEVIRVDGGARLGAK
jgi:NAD(P)-dependent dehydrogenase (short-subunit alcohol dehydrogenase family)